MAYTHVNQLAAFAAAPSVSPSAGDFVFELMMQQGLAQLHAESWSILILQRQDQRQPTSAIVLNITDRLNMCIGSEGLHMFTAIGLMRVDITT
eukprot:11199005-Karenia_brevis.AAC.5